MARRNTGGPPVPLGRRIALDCEIHLTAMPTVGCAGEVNHSILKPEALAPEVHQVVTEAIEHRFASVCVAPVWVAKVSAMLKGTGVACCSVAAFPHGTGKATLKAIEASSAAKDGAT